MISSEEYKKRAKALESNDFVQIGNRITFHRTITNLHACIGICTEAGELMDALKKYIFYGRTTDIVNIKEELGDLMWYMNLIIENYGWSWEEVMQANIDKLEFRYRNTSTGEKKFEETQANNRDLAAERKILEGEK